MMEEKGHQPVEQAGLTGKAAAVGAEVGGVRSSWEESGVDLQALSPEYRALLKALKVSEPEIEARVRELLKPDAPPA